MTRDDVPCEKTVLRRVFSEALLEMGRGRSAEEALVSACWELFPEMGRKLLLTALGYFLHVREKTGWGPLRAMRELATRLERWENPYRSEGLDLSRISPSDLAEVIRAAARRLEVGYSLEDSLEMAVGPAKPGVSCESVHTFLFLVKAVASLRDVGAARALRELADSDVMLSP